MDPYDPMKLSFQLYCDITILFNKRIENSLFVVSIYVNIGEEKGIAVGPPKVKYFLIWMLANLYVPPSRAGECVVAAAAVAAAAVAVAPVVVAPAIVAPVVVKDVNFHKYILIIYIYGVS